MDARKIWAVVCLSLGGFWNSPPLVSQESSGETPVALPSSREILVQSDHDGAILQRVTLDIADTRWLWRAEGALLLYEETPVAGGYIEERRTVGSPVEGLTHAAGCEVGPLTLGPIAFGGVYHRLLDPAAGGTEWTALTDHDGLRLDRGLEPGRWTGVGVSGALPFSVLRAEVIPGAVWSTDAETDIAATVLAVKWPIITVTTTGAWGSFAVRDDDTWLYEAPPFRADRVTQLGSTLLVRPTGGDGSVELGAEGWQQRVGYRPLRHSVQAFGRAPGQVIALAGRVSRTDSGFRALTGRRPRSAEYTGLTVSEGREIRPWIWRAAWERRAGWDNDIPGPTVDTYFGDFGLAWTRGVMRLFRLRGSTDSRRTHGLDYRLRFAAGPMTLLAYARHVWSHPSREDRFSAACRISLRTDVGRHRRRFSTSVGWDADQEGKEWQHDVAMRASIPLGRSFRLELSTTLPLVPVASWETTEWLLRLRTSATSQG